MNMRPFNDPTSRIARYLTGELSEREEVELFRTLEQDVEQRQLYEQLRLMWQSSGLPKQEWDARAALVQIKHRRPARAPLQVVPLPRAPGRILLRVAAGVAITLGAATLWRFGVFSGNHRTAASSFREFSTQRGERATLQLPDGTHFVLAANSRLRVPYDYGRAYREVYLEGEALFDVVHDATRPFRVLARNAVAEDLGTRFDVRAYAGDSLIAVAVAEGVVALGAAEAERGRDSPRAVTKRVVLRSGQVGMIAEDGTVATAAGPVTATYLTWAEGRLHFYKTPLAEVARVLSRWYDLDVQVADPALASTPVTAEFGVQTADELLHELALATGAEMTRSGKLVTLRPKP